LAAKSTTDDDGFIGFHSVKYSDAALFLLLVCIIDLSDDACRHFTSDDNCCQMRL
jgi:hypothetical protein